jgi:hypothetical protein
MEESGCYLLEVLSQYLPEGTEENKEKSKSG